MGRSYPVAELRGRCRIVRRIWNRSRYEIGHRIEIGLLEMLQTIAPLSEVSDAFRLYSFSLGRLEFSISSHLQSFKKPNANLQYTSPRLSFRKKESTPFLENSITHICV